VHVLFPQGFQEAGRLIWCKILPAISFFSRTIPSRRSSSSFFSLWCCSSNTVCPLFSASTSQTSTSKESMAVVLLVRFPPEGKCAWSPTSFSMRGRISTIVMSFQELCNEGPLCLPPARLSPQLCLTSSRWDFKHQEGYQTNLHSKFRSERWP
jgi:hypothetical protein